MEFCNKRVVQADPLPPVMVKDLLFFLEFGWAGHPPPPPFL